MRKIKNKGFLKNIAVLAGGTSVARALSIAASPLLARLFTAEDFALSAAFVSAATLFVILATGKYEAAVILPDDDDAKILLTGIFLLSGTVALISPLALFLLGNFNAACRLIIENHLLIYFVIFVFCMAVLEGIRYYFVRTGRFKAVSYRIILVSLVTVTLNLIGGKFFYSNKILIISSTFAQITALLLFAYLLFGKEKFPDFGLKDIFRILKKYRRFPKLTMPGQFINSLTGSLPVLVLSSFYLQSEIGQFAFVHRIISIPTGVIGKSVSQVFLQKISKADYAEQRRIFLRTAFLLFVFITACAVPCIVFSRELFGFAFGEKWLPASETAVILAPAYILQFAASGVSGPVFIVNQKLKTEFFLQIMRFVLVAGSFAAAYFFGVSFAVSMIFFGAAMSIWYILGFLKALSILNKGLKEGK